MTRKRSEWIWGVRLHGELRGLRETCLGLSDPWLTQRRKNYSGSDLNFLRPDKGNGNVAAAPEIFVLFVAKAGLKNHGSIQVGNSKMLYAFSNG